jgi:peroxiredoxin Q/BCP
MGILPGRETVVFDKSVTFIMQYNKIRASSHTKKALQKLKTL